MYNEESAAESWVFDVHDKKQKALMKNGELQFSSNEVIANLTSYKFTEDESELLQNGLKYSIQPKKISRHKVIASLKNIYYHMFKDISDNTKVSEIKNYLSHLVKTDHLSYKASRSTLQKH